MIPIFLLVTYSVSCKPDQIKLSKYERSLFVIYAAYTGIKHMEEICAKYYPKYKEQNSKAYIQWEIKYEDYLNEINHHWINLSFENIINEGSEMNLDSVVSNFMELNHMVEKEKEYAEQEIMKMDDKLELVCKTYPSVFLNLEMSDLEVYYKRETKIIRKKKNFAIE